MIETATLDNENIILQRSKDDRDGCDVCGGYSTEKFIGYCGGVLWLCDTCYHYLIEGNFEELQKVKGRDKSKQNKESRL